MLATACATTTDGTGTPGSTSSITSSSPSGSNSSGPSGTPTTTKPAIPTTPVKVSSVQGDNQTYGVGEPIIARFSPAPTDSSAFTKATTVTVNGAPANGAWYWERPYAGGPIEAHYRLQDYWPAHSTIHVDMPIKGLSAGAGLVYEDNLTLDFSIGARHVSRVNGQSLQMVVTSDGAVQKTIGVSLGKANTPTYNGTKVVMEKRNPQRMIGDGRSGPSSVYNELVPWSVRVTLDGEFIHAAPWNSRIGRASTSNGCTNLETADAEWFYKFSLLGDVVTYSGTSGGIMPALDGLGDWNLGWAQWKAGGLLVNHA